MLNSEHSTSLHDAEVVAKNHPQICFRGEIDCLYAEALYVCVYSKEQNLGEIHRQIVHICHVIKKLMAIEAEQTSQKVDDIIEMDSKWLRTVSNNPKTHIGTDHYLPNENDDMMLILLNKLRAKIRSTERACVNADVNYGANACLQESLNRLSSAIYIMMLRYKLKGKK